MVFILLRGLTANAVVVVALLEDLLAATEMEVPLDEDAVDGSVLTVSAIILLLLLPLFIEFAVFELWPTEP